MIALSRCVLAVLATAAVLVAAGCGGSGGSDTSSTATTAVKTTLDSSTYGSLNTGAQTLSTALSGLGTAAQSCAKKATDGVAAVRSCVADKLAEANTEISGLADTIEADAKNVAGECKTQLTAFAGALRTVVKTFGQGAKDIAGGDLQAGVKAVQNIDTSTLTSSGNAAQTACKPSATS